MRSARYAAFPGKGGDLFLALEDAAVRGVVIKACRLIERALDSALENEVGAIDAVHVPDRVVDILMAAAPLISPPPPPAPPPSRY